MKYDGADTLSICPELARWKQNVKGVFFLSLGFYILCEIGGEVIL